MPLIRTRLDCRMCGGLLRDWLEFTPTPIANDYRAEPDSGAAKYPLVLAQCLDCDHVQLRHVATGLFPKDYKYQTPKAAEAYLEPQAFALRKRYPKAKYALEIGCNNGLFLDCLAKAGFGIVGIDPCAKHVTGIRAPFTEAEARNFKIRFDLIVANNVFAHIDDLANVFRGIDYLLTDEGAVVFEVQHFPSLVESGAFDMIYHEHLDYHTLKPWEGFLKRFGLVITDVEYLQTHGGSIRVYAERPGERIVLPERTIDWRGFARRINSVRERLRQTLRQYERVAAFGATAKATTLIHHCGIAENIAWVYDETPQKQGRYIPGTDIPIRPVVEEVAGPLLLTAWNYADVFRKRFPKAELINPFL